MKKLLFPLVIMLMFFSAVKAEFVNNIVVNGNVRVSSETIILLGDIAKDKEYTETILNNIKQKRSFLSVGLDTDINKIPKHLLKEEDPIFEFNKRIIAS